LTKLDCLFQIILLMQSGKLFTAKVIGEKLNISTRNARAYLDTLINNRLPIKSVSGRRGGYYLDGKFSLNIPALTDKEIVALRLLREIAESQDEFQYSIDGITAISKILFTINNKSEQIVANNELNNHSTFDIIAIVHLAIEQKKKVKIIYQGIKDEFTNERIIHPYNMIFKNEAWYVYGFCELRREERLFKMMRINNMYLLDENFPMYDDEAFEHDMYKAFGLYRGDKEYKISIKFKYPASQWVKEKIWIENQQIEELNNREIIYQCKTEGLETIEHWVLGFGDMAEIIEPLELIEKVKSTLQKVLVQY